MTTSLPIPLGHKYRVTPGSNRSSPKLPTVVRTPGPYSPQTWLDWAYKTVPQTSANGQQQTLRSGRALGGSTIINGLAWSKPHDFQVGVTQGEHTATLADARRTYRRAIPLTPDRRNGAGRQHRPQLELAADIRECGGFHPAGTVVLEKLSMRSRQMRRAENFQPPPAAQAAAGVTYNAACHASNGPINVQYDVNT